VPADACGCKSGKKCGNACEGNSKANTECPLGACPCVVRGEKGDHCGNQRIARQQGASVEERPAGPKGIGLFALDAIKEREFVIEYTGEVMDDGELSRRKRDYAKNKQRRYYFMALGGGLTIDATKKVERFFFPFFCFGSLPFSFFVLFSKTPLSFSLTSSLSPTFFSLSLPLQLDIQKQGSLARYVNHSCDPNCETQQWIVEGRPVMALVALRAIAADEELSFSYNYERFGEEPIKCHCDAATCGGFLGKGRRRSGSRAADAAALGAPRPPSTAVGGKRTKRAKANSRVLPAPPSRAPRTASPPPRIPPLSRARARSSKKAAPSKKLAVKKAASLLRSNSNKKKRTTTMKKKTAPSNRVAAASTSAAPSKGGEDDEPSPLHILWTPEEDAALLDAVEEGGCRFYQKADFEAAVKKMPKSSRRPQPWTWLCLWRRWESLWSWNLEALHARFNPTGKSRTGAARTEKYWRCRPPKRRPRKKKKAPAWGKEKKRPKAKAG